MKNMLSTCSSIVLAAAIVLLGATNSSAVDSLNSLVPTTVEVPLVLRHDPFDQDLVLMVPPEFQIAVVARIPGARFIMPLAIPFAALSNSMTSMARMGKFSLAGSAMPRGSRLSRERMIFGQQLTNRMTFSTRSGIAGRAADRSTTGK